MSYLIFDIELSGVAAYDEVIEIAIIELYRDAKTYQWQQRLVFDTLISGAISIHPDHRMLTGLSNNDIQNPSLPTLSTVLSKLMTSYPNAVWASYGCLFDLVWIKHSLELNGTSPALIAEVDQIRWVCLLKLTQQMTGRKLSLDDICQTQREHHRALPDALLHVQLARRWDISQREYQQGGIPTLQNYGF
ncbi:exonuclease domain-containing protein [Vibrio mediterranei]|uniref:3'-5' exonuclease n=1 Tax=Vibrio mediterranei TaxID=689 RepID=UPI0038CE201E